MHRFVDEKHLAQRRTSCLLGRRRRQAGQSKAVQACLSTKQVLALLLVGKDCDRVTRIHTDAHKQIRIADSLTMKDKYALLPRSACSYLGSYLGVAGERTGGHPN